MRRVKENRRRGKAVFRRTAEVTRKINVVPLIARGGYCL